MTVHDALRKGIIALRETGCASAALDAEVLLRHAMNVTAEALIMHSDRLIAPTKLARFESYILRRMKHEPVAYIVGTKEFYGRVFAVDRAVLIPRPETEQLIDEVRDRFHHRRSVVFADVGTGSGCIAVTLARCFPNSSVLATDCSYEALLVAEKNARTHRVSTRVKFVQGDMLKPVERRHIDCIIANLPYVPDEEVRENPDLQYEPLLALRGRSGPEWTLRSFLKGWHERRDHPTAILEIHPNQAELIHQENQRIGVTVTIKKDLAGFARMAIIEYRSHTPR